MLHERATSRSRYFRELADCSRERLHAARIVADRCRYDEGIHRHAMMAVFALEDTLFALEQTAQGYEGANRDRRAPSCEAHPADDVA